MTNYLIFLIVFQLTNIQKLLIWSLYLNQNFDSLPIIFITNPVLVAMPMRGHPFLDAHQ